MKRTVNIIILLGLIICLFIYIFARYDIRIAINEKVVSRGILESEKHIWTLSSTGNANDVLSDDCLDMDLQDTADCLKRELKTFYNYSFRAENDVLSDEELKTNGGDCTDYSRWYVKRSKELGFEAYTLYINGDRMVDAEEVDHMTSYIYKKGDNDYCILDQMEVYCIEVGD